MPWWAQGLGIIYLSLPVIAIFAAIWHEEYGKTHSLWRSAFSALGQVVTGAVAIGIFAAIIYGVFNSADSEGLCGYPWDC